MRWPQTILVDMDSIIADFYFEVLARYTEETGSEVDPGCITAWDMALPNGDSMFTYFSKPGFFKSLAPIPKAQQVLRGLHGSGHEIIIVSSATLTNAPGEKYEWLTKHYPWIHRDRVIFAKEKFRVFGDIMIDDHHENVTAWKKFWRYRGLGPRTGLGIEYPYNKAHQDSFDLLAESYRDFEAAWSQIEERILRMAA